ncbi:hypothetical protein CANINC_004625 [Pichia inconspicua]|uniref:THO complex subunit 2 n=1 Tax=Pichia inconspicua TaxID=52247 RepID=A0A4T0WW11_9ASCO|nr:hypothetical protein CANINC_004625 [[Candida] inconspicua]
MNKDTMEVDTSVSTELNKTSYLYEWKYITDKLIQEFQTQMPALIETVLSDSMIVVDIFYEFYLTLSEYSERAELELLVQLSTDILTALKTELSNEKYTSLEEDIIVLSQSFITNEMIDSFVKNLSVDKSIKILHLDKAVLKSHNIFPDYSRYQYLDARKRVFSVDAYSSLHESCEGYSRYIMRLFGFAQCQSDQLDLIPTLLDSLTRLMTLYSLDNNRCFLLTIHILSNYVTSKREMVLTILKQSLWWSAKENNSAIISTVISYLSHYPEEECAELGLITLLIKEGLFDFYTIYNSLGPQEFTIENGELLIPLETDQMQILYEQTEKKMISDAQVSAVSALALASVLPDSDDEESTDAMKDDLNANDTDKKESIFDKAKQFRKVQFLRHLIEFEMIEEFSIVLQDYPRIPLIYDSVADRLNTFVENIITPYYMEHANPISLRKLNVCSSTITINSIDDILTVLDKFLKFNQYKIARSSSLMGKLIRLVEYEQKSGSKDTDFYLQFFRAWIFPNLPFLNNIPIINEAYSFLSKHCSLETRYNIYGEYMFKVSKDPTRKLNYDLAEKKTKDLLKRISIENISLSCRTLNKLVSVNPLATSNAFVSHIESYSSLIDLICEASKFFNDYAWDVITFQILNKLSGNRMIMQPDGLNYTQWFSNLTQFIGKLGKLYPESFQLSPILLYIVKNLMSGETNIIGVFKEILDSMTGIKSITNLTSKQIMRLNAEKSLKQLAFMSLQDNRESCRRSCTKLLKTLIDDEIFLQLFIMLCHIPINLIDNADTKPLKFVNQRCDDVNSLIHELITAVNENMDSTLFKENIISVVDLIETYCIQPQWAFELWRVHLAKDIRQNGNDSTAIFKKIKPSLVNSLEHIDWDFIKPELYFTFWTLSLYDINYEDISYMMEESDLRSELIGINMKLKRREELQKKDYMELEMKQRRVSDILKYLKSDKTVHEDHYKSILERLEKEKETWFRNDDVEKYVENSTTMFLQHCALPRLQHSSFDSVFVAKFIFFLNKLDTPVYSLQQILDVLFMHNFLPKTFFTNTTAETENLGLFYQIVMEKLNEWWKDETVYNRESKKFNDDLSFEDFKTLLFKWHDNLVQQILKSLDANDYTTKNNCILFLKVILNNYPIIKEHADVLADKLEWIVENDERDDIKLSSRALIGLIKFRESKYIHIWKFYEMDSQDKEAAMKTSAQKAKVAKDKEEEQQREAAEKERKEREKNQPVTKPYGLVGLGKRPSGPASAGSDKPTSPISTDGATEDAKIPIESTDIVSDPTEDDKKSNSPTDVTLNLTVDKENEEEPDAKVEQQRSDATIKLETVKQEQLRVEDGSKGKSQNAGIISQNDYYKSKQNDLKYTEGRNIKSDEQKNGRNYTRDVGRNTSKDNNRNSKETGRKSRENGKDIGWETKRDSVRDTGRTNQSRYTDRSEWSQYEENRYYKNQSTQGNRTNSVTGKNGNNYSGNYNQRDIYKGDYRDYGRESREQHQRRDNREYVNTRESRGGNESYRDNRSSRDDFGNYNEHDHRGSSNNNKSNTNSNNKSNTNNKYYNERDYRGGNTSNKPNNNPINTTSNAGVHHTRNRINETLRSNAHSQTQTQTQPLPPPPTPPPAEYSGKRHSGSYGSQPAHKRARR